MTQIEGPRVEYDVNFGGRRCFDDLNSVENLGGGREGFPEDRNRKDSDKCEEPGHKTQSDYFTNTQRWSL